MATKIYSICSRRKLVLTLHSSSIHQNLIEHRQSAVDRARTAPFRSISTSSLKNSWLDKIKGYIPGLKKSEDQPAQPAAAPYVPPSFSLENYADELKKARKMGALEQFAKGRSGQVTMSEAIQKQEAIIRALASYDSTGEHLEAKHKVDAAKRCNCTMVDVENALSKFTWAKAAQKKIDKLKEEGKPMPKNLAEVQKLVGSSPIDIANSALAKPGKISRNANCPCGSMKKYKKCCGKHVW
ncbi:uncharacterized protein LOC131078101 [Cryptomeria japonica]|uniref:uncharacterized protein LOC131078101 n=1 Tax=Cryptomeria japonica TaxID=3369 RepID=UPI0027DA07E6|nr:uncharacterized protein LOC131078101 [Cryptomeria japonica]